jgi:hypothetical protein
MPGDDDIRSPTFDISARSFSMATAVDVPVSEEFVVMFLCV